ncbi:nuclear transport factor 2 family protein [Elongatibacter sediminis]|uniref:Nuclear transport factor 2 family protein n=1 Tax=Elongatibacter sediminis TaxID=3119006 RepID=A0AAW9RCI5_9GAMM
MSEPIDVVNGIIEAWKRTDIDGVLAHLTEDVEYHYVVGERPLVGHEWVRRFLEKFGTGQTDIRWRIVNHAQAGNKILVEGIDDYVDAEGRRIRTPYMGIFELRDGRVCGWRDYVDTGLIAKAKAQEDFPEWLETLCSKGD